MRIGVDASCWSNPRGYGRFTRELMHSAVEQASGDSFVFFADSATATEIPNLPDVEIRIVQQSVAPSEAATADGNRSPADMLRFTRAVWRDPCDVFFFPSVYTFFPLPPGQRAVVTIHDAIAERFPALTFPNPKSRLFWNLKVGLAIRQADLVLTVSEYAAQDLERVLHVPRSRIRVSGEAPSPAYMPTTDSKAIEHAARAVGVPPGHPWFTYVGGFNPHKHVDAIVRAHARLCRSTVGPEPHLLLVGPTDRDVFYGDDGVAQAIAEAGTKDSVHCPGYLPDEDLRFLHAGARALVLPSACEGYGLPAVEAAACGTAVIVTRESPIPDILNGGGFWVTPGDDDELHDAMSVLLNDESVRDRMKTQASARASELTWHDAANRTLDCLREAAA